MALLVEALLILKPLAVSFFDVEADEGDLADISFLFWFLAGELCLADGFFRTIVVFFTPLAGCLMPTVDNG